MLSVENITMKFGGITALNNASMRVSQGEIHGLIGPNGSGKSTLVNIITGFYKPTSGCIKLKDEVISGKHPHEISFLGVCRTFQNINLFSKMTVLENVLTALSVSQNTNLVNTMLRLDNFKKQEKECIEKANELLENANLHNKKNLLAENLTYGQQRLLEIIRALATSPQILILDEPVAGMNEKESLETAAFIKNLQNMGLTILLIEHHMRFVMSLCNSITVLDYGAVICDGCPELVQNDQKVIETYLGTKKVKVNHATQHI